MSHQIETTRTSYLFLVPSIFRIRGESSEGVSLFRIALGVAVIAGGYFIIKSFFSSVKTIGPTTQIETAKKENTPRLELPKRSDSPPLNPHRVEQVVVEADPDLKRTELASDGEHLAASSPRSHERNLQIVAESDKDELSLDGARTPPIKVKSTKPRDRTSEEDTSFDLPKPLPLDLALVEEVVVNPDQDEELMKPSSDDDVPPHSVLFSSSLDEDDDVPPLLRTPTSSPEKRDENPSSEIIDVSLFIHLTDSGNFQNVVEVGKDEPSLDRAHTTPPTKIKSTKPRNHTSEEDTSFDDDMLPLLGTPTSSPTKPAERSPFLPKPVCIEKDIVQLTSDSEDDEYLFHSSSSSHKGDEDNDELSPLGTPTSSPAKSIERSPSRVVNILRHVHLTKGFPEGKNDGDFSD